MNRPETPGPSLPGPEVPGPDAASGLTDGEGVVRAWSRGAQRLLGHEPGEAVGRPARQFVAGPLPGPVRRSLAAREPWLARLRLHHRAGGTVHAEVRGFPVLDGAGGHQWLLLASDEPQDARLLRWAYDQSETALAIYDADARLRYVNDAALAELGVSREHAVGRRPDEFLPPVAGDPPMPTATAGAGAGGTGMLGRPTGPDGGVTEILTRVTTLIHQVLRTGEPARMELDTATPDEPRRPSYAIQISPLRDPGGTVRGVFTAAGDISEQVGARRRLALLNEAGQRLGGRLDVTETAGELAGVVTPGLCDFAAVDLFPSVLTGDEPPADPVTAPVTLRRVAVDSVRAGAPETAVPLGGRDVYTADSPPGRCLAARRGVVLDTADPGFRRWLETMPRRRAAYDTYGFHSVLAVPLRARGVALGVALLLRSRPHPFSPDDVLLAEELCARAAVGIDNARRYARERATALALQRSLLPRRLHGMVALHVASRYLPAGSRAGVGGDWFDVIPLSGTRVALVIGDVVGHGLHASATMGRLRTAVRTLADVDLPPDELLTHLDDLVTHLAEQAAVAPEPGPGAAGEVGATCLYAVYDPVSRRCVAASAGHPPPVVVTPDGQATVLGLTPGPPLGIGGLPFEATDVTLPEGSLLALYTDGLIAPRVRAFDTGQRMLGEALRPPSGDLTELCDRAVAVLLPERPTDDAALLLARTRALDAQHVATFDIAPEPSQVGYARSAAVRQLTEWGLGEAAFVTELVVSELVTNALRHARPPIRLRLIRGTTTLICEVSDGSSTSPHLRRARTFDEGGRGLLLVAQLTQGWGTRQTTSGKTIWAEQPLPATAG